MPIRVQVDAKKVIAKLEGLSLKARVAKDTEVGYSAPYAMFVHENLAARHPRGGQAKYLQDPARKYATVMGRMVATRLKQKKGLTQAMLEAAEFLKGKSQELVPVLTGKLKQSAYARAITL